MGRQKASTSKGSPMSGSPSRLVARQVIRAVRPASATARDSPLLVLGRDLVSVVKARSSVGVGSLRRRRIGLGERLEVGPDQDLDVLRRVSVFPGVQLIGQAEQEAGLGGPL